LLNLLKNIFSPEKVEEKFVASYWSYGKIKKCTIHHKLIQTMQTMC